MPLGGLVPDSPWIYYGKKAFSKSKISSRAKSIMSGGKFDWEFKKLVIYHGILNSEMTLPRGMVGRSMSVLGAKMVVKAKAQVGKETGALARSIGMSVSRAPYGVKLTVHAKDKKAYMHHEGTRPKVILPKNPGGVLVFGKGTRVIKTERVMHPGTRANRFLSDQLREVPKHFI
jgi:hypothetical protein